MNTFPFSTSPHSSYPRCDPDLSGYFCFVPSLRGDTVYCKVFSSHLSFRYVIRSKFLGIYGIFLLTLILDHTKFYYYIKRRVLDNRLFVCFFVRPPTKDQCLRTENFFPSQTTLIINFRIKSRTKYGPRYWTEVSTSSFPKQVFLINESQILHELPLFLFRICDFLMYDYFSVTFSLVVRDVCQQTRHNNYTSGTITLDHAESFETGVYRLSRSFYLSVAYEPPSLTRSFFTVSVPGVRPHNSFRIYC